MSKPNVLVVCDHGVRADHSACDHRGGCREVEKVALLPWLADKQGWWPAHGVDEDSLHIWPMEGDVRGHDTKWLRPEWTSDDEADLRRDAIEITCREQQCTLWAFRADDATLQTVLHTLASDSAIRDALCLFADDSLLVITLDNLRLARKHLS